MMNWKAEEFLIALRVRQLTQCSISFSCAWASPFGTSEKLNTFIARLNFNVKDKSTNIHDPNLSRNRLIFEVPALEAWIQRNKSNYIIDWGILERQVRPLLNGGINPTGKWQNHNGQRMSIWKHRGTSMRESGKENMAAEGASVIAIPIKVFSHADGEACPAGIRVKANFRRQKRMPRGVVIRHRSNSTR